METKFCKASLRPAVSPDGETGFFVSAPDYDLEKTFDCGQCFRFTRILNSPYACEYEGVAHGRYVRFASGDGGLYIFGASEDEACAVWTPYLSLDTDYAAIRAQILRDLPFPAMREAVAAAGGIRILRQERFETLCSFILSQNNNIPRIKKIIEALCAYCGAPLDMAAGAAVCVSDGAGACTAFRRTNSARSAAGSVRGISPMRRAASLRARWNSTGFRFRRPAERCAKSAVSEKRFRPVCGCMDLAIFRPFRSTSGSAGRSSRILRMDLTQCMQEFTEEWRSSICFIMSGTYWRTEKNEGIDFIHYRGRGAQLDRRGDPPVL